MPLFQFRGRNRQGELTAGTVEAADLGAAADEVSAQGIIPLNIELARGGGGGFDYEAFRRRFLEPRVTVDDLVMFIRQLYSLLHAGVPIIRALRGLADNTRNPRLARTIRETAGRLENGRSLAESMSAFPDVFPTLLIALVRVGEDSGRLEESLLRMATNLEQERNTREQVKTALRYPTFVMIAIVIAIGIVNVFVIPAFSDVFDQMGAELPLPTVMLIAVSEFTTSYWPLMIGAVIAAVSGFKAWARTARGRLVWDRIKLRFPLVGKIMLRALLARFGRTLSMALRSGVPVLQALSAVARTTDNAHVGRGVESMRQGIERGESLLQVARETELFTPLVLQMLAVGEETGRVSEMMDQVAEFYEREVESDLAKLSSYIEPIVIGFIGLLVLILALGIFLPMWQMGEAAM